MSQINVPMRIAFSVVLSITPLVACLYLTQGVLGNCPNVQAALGACPTPNPPCSLETIHTCGLGDDPANGYFGATSPNNGTYVDFTATQIGCYIEYQCQYFPGVGCEPDHKTGNYPTTSLFTNYDCGE
jgi:hypothetical protein